MVLRDTIEVQAPISRLFEFFDGMSQERYLGWHPDHKRKRGPVALLPRAGELMTIA
jgi:hypothetical protein